MAAAAADTGAPYGCTTANVSTVMNTLLAEFRLEKKEIIKKMCILKAEQIYVCSPNGPHTHISAIFSEPISL